MADQLWLMKRIREEEEVKNYLILMKFCTQQQILNWMNVTLSKMKKLHWTDSDFDRTYFLFTCKLGNELKIGKAHCRSTSKFTGV